MKYFVNILMLSSILSCSKQNKNQLVITPEQHPDTLRTKEIIKKNNSILISELSNNSLDILANLISEKCKGNVVYVDIWATWCRPCLAEIPYSKNLESKFVGKNIKFLTLCCSSKQDIWESTISQYEIPGEHHLLNENQCAHLRDRYHLVAFPSYLIFNKSGTLIYADAPRPSSNEIEGILNELVEK